MRMGWQGDGGGKGEVSVIDFVNLGNAGFSWPSRCNARGSSNKVEVKSRRKSTRELKISHSLKRSRPWI